MFGIMTSLLLHALEQAVKVKVSQESCHSDGLIIFRCEFRKEHELLA